MNDHGNYPDERGTGVEPLSPHLQERQSKRWEEYRKAEAREAAALDATWVAYEATKKEASNGN